jgi:Cof subfamily protein (haloacid dehalogenase superfamily)
LIRLLALDLDGTLLTGDKSLPPRVVDAVEAAARAGIRVVLVTGRRYPSARTFADRLTGLSALAVHTGALVFEREERLRCLPLSQQAARAALAVGRARGAASLVHCGQRGEGWLLVDRETLTSAPARRYVEATAPKPRVVADLTAFDEDPVQVMFAGESDAMESLAGALSKRLDASARVEMTLYPGLGIGFLDVLNPRAGKAEALRFLGQRWGIGTGAMAAVGDNWNDREMLQSVGLGLVMGNAEPRLKALGLPILPSNEACGVAEGISGYVLPRASERGSERERG